jgi:hypothetical protein
MTLWLIVQLRIANALTTKPPLLSNIVFQHRPPDHRIHLKYELIANLSSDLKRGKNGT